jgi:hypothetical protein
LILRSCVGCNRHLQQVAYPSLPRRLRWTYPLLVAGGVPSLPRRLRWAYSSPATGDVPVATSQAALGATVACYRWCDRCYLTSCVGCSRRLLQVAYPLLPRRMRWVRPSPATGGATVDTSQLRWVQPSPATGGVAVATSQAAHPLPPCRLCWVHPLPATGGVPIATSQAALGVLVACCRWRDRCYLAGCVGCDRHLLQVGLHPSLPRRLRWARPSLPRRLRWARPSPAIGGVLVVTLQAALGATVACYRRCTRRYLTGCVGRDRRLLQVVHPSLPRRLRWVHLSPATSKEPDDTSQAALGAPVACYK